MYYILNYLKVLFPIGTKEFNRLLLYLLLGQQRLQKDKESNFLTNENETEIVHCVSFLSGEARYRIKKGKPSLQRAF